MFIVIDVIFIMKLFFIFLKLTEAHNIRQLLIKVILQDILNKYRISHDLHWYIFIQRAAVCSIPEPWQGD